MFYTSDTRYYLSRIVGYEKESGSYILDHKHKTKKFESESELIRFLASCVNTHGKKDFSRWTCVYFNSQNLTGTDKDSTINSVEYISLYKTIEIDNIAKNIFYTKKDDKHITLVDVRKYKAEIFKLVYAQISDLVKDPRKHTFIYNPWDKSWRGKENMRPKRHVHYNGRWCSTQRMAKLFDPEYKEFSKPKYKCYVHGYWDDEWASRHSAGWKYSTKNRHQWEAKAAREEKKIKRSLKDC